MRYTIQTTDEQGIIGIQISKWEKDGKLTIIEKSDTLVEIQSRLSRVTSALEILKKAGYNSEVMEIFIRQKTGVGKAELKSILYEQEKFLKQIGALR